jgi:hypothetical protein
VLLFPSFKRWLLINQNPVMPLGKIPGSWWWGQYRTSMVVTNFNPLIFGEREGMTGAKLIQPTFRLEHIEYSSLSLKEVDKKFQRNIKRKSINLDMPLP